MLTHTKKIEREKREKVAFKQIHNMHRKFNGKQGQKREKIYFLLSKFKKESLNSDTNLKVFIVCCLFLNIIINTCKEEHLWIFMNSENMYDKYLYFQ